MRCAAVLPHSGGAAGPRRGRPPGGPPVARPHVLPRRCRLSSHASAAAPDRAALEAALAAAPTPHALVAVTDLDGVLRGKLVHRERLLPALDAGLGFCSVIFGWDCEDRPYAAAAGGDAGGTRGGDGHPDALVRPDVATLRHLAHAPHQPLVLGDCLAADGTPLPLCPRQLLRRQVAALAQLGYVARVGVELEWSMCRETPQSWAARGAAAPQPLSPGMFGYSVLRCHQGQPLMDALLTAAAHAGIEVEALHTETGPGALEAALAPCGPLEAADRAVLFRTVAKQVAHDHGATASFMAKLDAALPGAGGHLHVSLARREGAPPAREAVPADGPVAGPCRALTAGLMAALPALLPLLLPNVNSYKRLAAGRGAWAPTHMGWGVDDREAALRVLHPRGPQARVEVRIGGADANPYLAIAAVLAGACHGLQAAPPLPPPRCDGDGPQTALPSDLGAATEAMAAAPLSRRLLGDAFVGHFLHSRRLEWQAFKAAVTDWERRRYFEII